MGTSQEIFDALAPLGFENNDAVCYGTWKGYAVCLHRFAAKIYFIYVAVQSERYPLSLQRALRKAVKEKGRPMEGIERFAKRVVIVSASFSKTDDIAGRFAERMDAIVGALRENGVLPADTCALSGSAHPDSLCLVTLNNVGSYQPVCASAVRSRNLETQERLETNENSGNYLLGILGAVLGMLVGLIPNVLTILFTETIYALLFALVPIAAMFGYKLFRGKMNTVSVVAVIVVSLLGVVLIPYIEFVYYILQSYSLSLGDAMYAALQLMLDPEVLSDLTGELLQLLLFMALGLFVAWRFLRGNVNSNVAAASRAQLDSLRPNPAFAARPEEPAQDEE